MSPEIHQHLSQRIREFSQFIATPEAENFDDSQLWNSLSSENQEFFAPVREELRLHNACLNQVYRWQGHPYEGYIEIPKETDFQHVLGMLEIVEQLKELGLFSFNFIDIERKIVIHDSGEIITGDVPLVHVPDMEQSAQYMKEIENRCFRRGVLSKIRESSPDIYESLRSSYVQYQSRCEHPEDKESHLIKYIDALQGNKYGVLHVYRPGFSIKSKTSLNPQEMIEFARNRENSFLENIFNSSEILFSDKQILFDFHNNHQIEVYS